MNKTIQSASYRSYSKSLMEMWTAYFEQSPQDNMSFLEKNALRCLTDFQRFASNYERQARDLAANLKEFNDLDATQRQNFQVWLDEKISKALDVYWAPLSQALTQCTSPAYKIHLEELLVKQNLQPTLERFINGINELSGNKGADALSIDDILLFFDELTLIRRLPYTKFAFIGIPFRVFDSPESSIDTKLTGVAHELGHYLYWQLADFDQVNIRQKDILQQIVETLESDQYRHDEKEIRYIKTWIEELFADFVGAKLAGQSYINACKEIVIRNNKTPESLGDNDQEHVPDILRPLVSIYTTNRDRSKAMDAWKLFFQESFPVDMSKIEIQFFRNQEDNRDIIRYPEQLNRILLDTIDIFFDKTGNGGASGLFYSKFTGNTDTTQLAGKATRLASEQKDNKMTDLDLFLEPIALEAEQQSHPHQVKTTNQNSHHGKTAFTITHTH